EAVELRSKDYWVVDGVTYFASSAVNKIAYRDGLLVGLTNYGLLVVGKDRVVRYNIPVYRERYLDAGKLVQRAQDVAIDDKGNVYVAGVDMLGVYEQLPDRLVPKLYARKDCRFDYGPPRKRAF
ncbi:MAG: hypothetical protein AAB227_05595, partial [Pseudomonadota bacterium]